jgi:outer membrane protein assembly factor BamD
LSTPFFGFFLLELSSVLSTGGALGFFLPCAAGTSVGVEVLSPGVTAAPVTGTAASDRPSSVGAPDPNYGLSAPKALSAPTAALPPIEKADGAPDQVNESTAKPTPTAVPAAHGKKKPKAPPVDKTDESSSKKKPKKGVDKLNPF